MPRSKHPWPQTSRIHGELEDQFLSFISDHISLKSGKKNVFLVISYKKPTLGGRGPGYRFSAAVEDGGWLHTVSRPQSPWSVCSGRSPQPPGHLHTTMHGHSQFSVPGGEAEGRDGPGGASVAALGLLPVGKHSLTPRAASLGAAALAAESVEAASRTSVRCLLSTSKRSAWRSLRSMVWMSTKGGCFLAQHIWLSTKITVPFLPSIGKNLHL